MSTRRRALQQAYRSGVPVGELLKLYDTTTDPQMKSSLVEVYAQSGDRAAVDKMMTIAKNEENLSIRRKTISQLSRSEDPRVKEFLRAIVER
jgi:aromatic ring hydroxylase